METVVREYRSAILHQLRCDDRGDHFLRPLNVRLLGIPHYRSVIKRPIDLYTIEMRFYEGEYGSGARAYGPEGVSMADALCWDDDAAFWADLMRVYTNALTFFGPTTKIHLAARRALPKVIQARIRARRAIARARQAEDEAMVAAPPPAPPVVKAKAKSKAAAAKAEGPAPIPYYVLQGMGRAMPGLSPALITQIAMCVVGPGEPLSEDLEFNLDELPRHTQHQIKAILDANKVKY